MALLVGIDVRGATAWPIAAMAVPVVGYAIGPRIFNRYLSDLPNLGGRGRLTGHRGDRLRPLCVLQPPGTPVPEVIGR